MRVKPQIRLLFLISIVLIQFFLLIAYANSLASKNVVYTRLQANISNENKSRGEYFETVNQSLNERLNDLVRSENIQRISQSEAIKIRDIQPSTPTPENDQPQDTNNSVIVY